MSPVAGVNPFWATFPATGLTATRIQGRSECTAHKNSSLQQTDSVFPQFCEKNVERIGDIFVAPGGRHVLTIPCVSQQLGINAGQLS